MEVNRTEPSPSLRVPWLVDLTWHVALGDVELFLAPLFVPLLDARQDVAAVGTLIDRILEGKSLNDLTTFVIKLTHCYFKFIIKRRFPANNYLILELKIQIVLDFIVVAIL